MKKLWTLTALLICATLAMAQFAHAANVENVNCDTLKMEQHVKTPAEKVSSSQDSSKAMAKTNCCESCHIQFASLPIFAVEKTAVQGESFAAIPAAQHGIFLDTLSEPPQA